MRKATSIFDRGRWARPVGVRPLHRTARVFAWIAVGGLIVGSGPLALGVVGAIPGTQVTGGTNLTCNPRNSGPSSLFIVTKNPGHAVASDRLNVSFEFKVVHFKLSDAKRLLSFPTVNAVFPLVTGGSIKVGFAPKTLPAYGPGWSLAGERNASLLLTGNTSFAAKDAYLTSSKIAVMVTADYGALTLQVRWHWSLYHALTGLTKVGVWTVPTNTSSGNALPSSFYPAPWVGVYFTSGSSVPSGSNYTVGLNGSVASTWFRVVLEFPNNGTEIQSIIENSTAAAQFNATVPIAYGNGTAVAAGPYLIHVHDHCQAIVHILSIHAT